MISHLKRAFAAALLVTVIGQPVCAHAEAAFQVQRAINIAQWFTWPRYEASGSGIHWPPYKDVPRPPDRVALEKLRRAGFDTVRLPVDPAPFIVFEGERRAAVYGFLFQAIADIHAAGLKVIIDIHPNSRHPIWGQYAVIAGLKSPAFSAVADVIEEMARRLSQHTSFVALELLNEPRLKCKGSDQALWQDMVQALVARAKSVNPALTLVVTGACVSSPDGLLALDPAPFAAPNVLYTFHFYEPFSFTHQGAQFIPWPDKYLDGVPWPAGVRPISEPVARLQEHMKTFSQLTYPERLLALSRAKNNLERFYASGANAAAIRRRFGEVANWARIHNIPLANVFIGEFGVVRRQPGKPGAFCKDRARWHQDVRDAAAAYGFSWAYFNYDGPFGLVEDGTRQELDPVVLASLGLQTACSGAADPGDEEDAAGNAREGRCEDLCPRGE